MDERLIRLGPADQLFGVYHASDGPGPAVVFCAPFAEEKKCSYRTFVEAARVFAGAGIPCLRFDYFGTGDSAGAFSDFSVGRAVADIAAAAEAVRGLSGGPGVTLLGLRLGGSLALAAAPRAGAERVILWQPVVSGRAFFDLAIRRQMLRRQLIGGGGAASDDAEVIDLDGFPLSRSAGEAIRALDGAAAAAAFDGPIHLLQVAHSEALSGENRQLAGSAGDRLSAACVVCEPFWNRIDHADPSAVIARTLEWLV